ncbi:hypothetical protein BXY57_1307 [Thermoflavifilum aggregans]|uniref:Alpha-L-rhamnosidase six-hairpin glycosidase domain-containing protein n=1 Tax=Thermoflavifilum aggregans TaxID=454188 RepID=A0A2M9CUY0_9BACT|nr:hypothetical protein [Thermoflavifilum aggregans]PJJ75722.1 hypothetical protein BXY57_1307 [Thermoflavifilum aggregans]
MYRYLFFCFLCLILSYQGDTQTTFSENTGKYGEFLQQLVSMIQKDAPLQTYQVEGKKYDLFVEWLRDHVYVLQAMKYFSPHVRSGVELFLDQQTPQGFFYDYIYPIDDGVNNRLNFFDRKYTKVFPGEKLQMHRLPVEADVEYLAVQGVYHIWQATGDTLFIKQYLPVLRKAMTEVMTDPVRWSRKYQLVKRGYTIDTWDFQALPMSIEEFHRRYGDPSQGIMNVCDTTPMGIMHGDNSGYFDASRKLSALYAITGDSAEAHIWQLQAELLRARANTYCWNGKYYKHFVPDDPVPDYLHIDEAHTLSLSNAYDINRGLPTELMAESIIQTYQDLYQRVKDSCIAEWFGIYPAYAPEYAGAKPGTYVNGGILTVVAGELARAAFQHGYESYGVDILNRLMQLSEKNNHYLYAVYRPDGTPDGGMPDAWAQAAVVSALIEGLAGVVDASALFQQIELSPRWMATGLKQATVQVSYPASGKTFGYSWLYDDRHRKIELSLKGDARRVKARIWLPAEAVDRASAFVNQQRVPAHLEWVRQSPYLVFTCPGNATLQVKW